MLEFAERGNLNIVSGSSGPSYFGKNGSVSRVDHALVAPHIEILGAEYIHEGIVPNHSDHAALLVSFKNR